MIQIGNMQASEHTDGANKVICHCGNEFIVSGLKFSKDGTIVKHQFSGELNHVTVEGIKITCPRCLCHWSVKKSKTEIPKPLRQKDNIKLKYFVAHATIGDKEVELALGTAYDMPHFLALTLGSISKYTLASLRVSEITHEEAVKVYSKMGEDARNSLTELFEAFLSR